MKRAAETTCWWMFGSEREDWVMPPYMSDDQAMHWVADWVVYWRFKHGRRT
jgi:hypothetical protein